MFSPVEEDPARRQHSVGEDSYHHHHDRDEHYHKGMATMILIAQVRDMEEKYTKFVNYLDEDSIDEKKDDDI